jgi:hypothetical protein
MNNLKKVSISIGGGLGDCIQTYLANPESEISDGENNFPTTNHRASIWLRRLRSFKEIHSDVEIALITTSHNKYTKDLFITNPYIDHILEYAWTLPSDPHFRYWEHTQENCQDNKSTVDAEEEYNPIFWYYDYLDYAVSEFNLFLTEEDKETVNKIKPDRDYVTCHPVAPPPRDILPLYKYWELQEILKEIDISTVLIGMDNDYINVRVSIDLILSSNGFAGTHSSMWLPAVYKAWKDGVKTVCFIPKNSHFDRIRGTAVAWGFDQPFNLLLEYENKRLASQQNMQEVADWIINAS